MRIVLIVVALVVVLVPATLRARPPAQVQDMSCSEWWLKAMNSAGGYDSPNFSDGLRVGYATGVLAVLPIRRALSVREVMAGIDHRCTAKPSMKLIDAARSTLSN